MAKKETIKKETVKKEKAPSKDNVKIPIVEVPKEILNTDLDDKEIEVEGIDTLDKITQKISESQDKVNSTLENVPFEDAKDIINEELSKMNEMKEEVEKVKEGLRYTSLWNGINFNL